LAKRIVKAVMQLPPLLIFVIVLVAMAATVARAAATRDAVGAFEYVTVAAIIAVLVLCAFRLSRRAIRRAYALPPRSGRLALGPSARTRTRLAFPSVGLVM
jgi:hypothetical protein